MGNFEIAIEQANSMAARGASAAEINQMLAGYGYGSALTGALSSPAAALDAWIGTTPAGGALPGTALTAADQSITSFLTNLGINSVIKWLVGIFGIGALGAALVAVVGKDTIAGWIGTAIATIIPGVQGSLGEFPPGLGSIEGREVRRWSAGGQRTYFAVFEQPTKSGSHLQYYAYSQRRGAWLPYSYRRNIVFGAKELELAAALGHRKHMGKKKVLQAIAGHFNRPKK